MAFYLDASVAAKLVVAEPASRAMASWAATLDPEELRSLDALHLAAALELGDELDGIVTYYSSMAAAASLYGVAVIAPT